jgi:thiopurine S-methyltransferase
MLGPVDAVYDRAALVALPASMRDRYIAHLTSITAKAPQLLICYEYDQSAMEGPPFSITGEEVLRYYAATYDAKLLASAEVPGGLKGKCSAKEHVWLLRSR